MSDDLVQFLTPEGVRATSGPDTARFDADFTLDQTLDFFRDLTLLRRLDTEATALQRHGELALWAPCLGQEAAQIGCGRALQSQDYAFPSYREHGIALARGLDPLHLLSLFRGADLGGWDPADQHLALYSIVIGSQALHAVGYAMGIQRDGAVGTGDPERDAAVVACFGDGATSQGDVHEAMVFAASFNAPVVFFCQNNQWAISEPLERQSKVPLVRRATGYGIEGIRVDGNDVLAVNAVTRWALDHAREGSGPVLIEAVTYRMGAHTTTDDPTRYRTAAEVERWRLKDPIARVEAWLRHAGSAPDDFFATVAAQADTLGERLRSQCRTLPDPKLSDLFAHLYADLPDELAAQRDQVRAIEVAS